MFFSIANAYIRFGRIANPPERGDILELVNYKPMGAECELYEKDGVGYYRSKSFELSMLGFNSDHKYQPVNWYECFRNFRPDVDADEIKRVCNFSIYNAYFSRIFKEVTGSNYNRWLNAVRVEKAVSLLPEEGLSLTEIAMLSGFKSIPSFNRVFAQFKNAPPSVYRRMIKDNTITEDE